MKGYEIYTIPCGLLLIGIGLLIRFHIGKRRFDRRGIGGQQRFSSYWRSVWIPIMENLLLFIAMLCGSIGSILLSITGWAHIK